MADFLGSLHKNILFRKTQSKIESVMGINFITKNNMKIVCVIWEIVIVLFIRI